MKKPKIIFIHQNFPGQFLDIAPYLAEKLSAEVRFLSYSNNEQQIKLTGVTLDKISRHRDVNNNIHHYLHSTEAAVLNGQAVIRKLHELSSKGYQPDIVITHAGFGFSNYVRCILPNCKIVAYAEWYFTRENVLNLMPSIDIDRLMSLETQNIPIMQDTLSADLIICPTKWQASQFPKRIASTIEVIFDGVNTKLFHDGFHSGNLKLEGSDLSEPIVIQADTPLLTYGTRGMEPMRGFPQFMRAAAYAQKRIPDLQVVIFGKDIIAYGMNDTTCPNESGSWKKSMIEELADDLDLSRIHFTGLITYGSLAKLFRRTNLHCYFTEPYVVSWGVFQAAASGCPLLTNNFPGLDEVIKKKQRSHCVNLKDQTKINKAVASLLKKPADNTERECNLASGKTLANARQIWLEKINELANNVVQPTKQQTQGGNE